MANMLGTIDTVEIALRPRGGGTPWATIRTPPVAGGSIELAEGDTSSGSFSVTSQSRLLSTTIESVDALQRLIVPWSTEAAVSVNGVELLTGPVVNVKGNLVEVQDFSAWWGRRDTKGHQIDSDDPVRIFRAVHDAGMADDLSPNFGVQAINSGLTWAFQSDELDYRKLSDSLKSIRRAGISWFSRGRSIYVRGPQEARPVGEFSDRHFVGTPLRHHRGKTQANYVRVIGANTTENGPLIGVAKDQYSINQNGLLIRTFRDSKLDSETAVNQAAKSRLANLKFPLHLSLPTPTGLAARAPIKISELIPGSVYRVTSAVSGGQVSGLFRIEKVRIEFAGLVSVSWQPVAEDGEL